LIQIPALCFYRRREESGGHCQKSKGVFQKAADKYSNNITFATVDNSGTRGAKPASEESQIIAVLASKHFDIPTH